jgi:hypothetical protein
VIQFLSDTIDQLDLALDQIAVQDRNFDRFALMLVDNVMELTLHQFVQDKAGENELWENFSEPRNDPKVIERALSQNFDNKAKGASKLGLCSAETCETILNLHGFRNTFYHKGLRHEGILHSLAIFYFSVTCKVLMQYEPRYWSWSSSDQYSLRAMKYLGKPTFGDHDTIFQNAFARLEEVASQIDCDIIQDLAVDMESTIDSIDHAIEFLATDSPRKSNRDQVVIDAQVWSFAFTEEASRFASENGCNFDRGPKFLDWIGKNYDVPVKHDPIDGWRRRNASLSSETDEGKALKRYCDFLRQTESIRAQLMESAAQLDAYIQQQIDLARGK